MAATTSGSGPGWASIARWRACRRALVPGLSVTWIGCIELTASLPSPSTAQLAADDRMLGITFPAV